jgi:hypothetical protein
MTDCTWLLLKKYLGIVEYMVVTQGATVDLLFESLFHFNCHVVA